MAEVYRIFSRHWEHVLDFSDEALLNMYNNESYGTINDLSTNGYAEGKKWLDVHVTAWKEDIAKGELFKHELYEDKLFPKWWLDQILKDVHNNYAIWYTRDR